MYVIGLTGGIASGKSTVSQMLRQLGAHVIDADLIAKLAIEPGTPAWEELVREFGEEILTPEKTIDRKKLGERVFGNPTALRRLNEITHPRIIRRIEEIVEEIGESFDRTEDPKEERIVVIDAPLLIETGMVSMVDEVWVVVVDVETQVDRLMARDHYEFEQALNRINAQMPLQEKVKFADVVIDNTGCLEETRRQVAEAWCRLGEKLRRRPGRVADDGL